MTAGGHVFRARLHLWGWTSLAKQVRFTSSAVFRRPGEVWRCSCPVYRSLEQTIMKLSKITGTAAVLFLAAALRSYAQRDDRDEGRAQPQHQGPSNLARKTADINRPRRPPSNRQNRRLLVVRSGTRSPRQGSRQEFSRVSTRGSPERMFRPHRRNGQSARLDRGSSGADG